jgi:YD repeat-containing protein
MTSYTYNPLVGKTSEIDPSGKAVNYQYDAFSRPQLVLDQDKNIVSDNAYQYATQPSVIRVFATNNTQYPYTPSIIPFTIDAQNFQFPQSNTAGQQLVGYIVAGTHTFLFPCTTSTNPSTIHYTITGPGVTCGAPLTYSISQDIYVTAY